MVSIKREFHWADYLVFFISLAMGLVLGLISMVTQKKDQTNRGYLLGGGNMNVLVVGAGMLLSYLNAVYIFGTTAEVSYRQLSFLYCINMFAVSIQPIPVVLLDSDLNVVYQ